MATAVTATKGRFAQSLHRATAQRGRLDPVYQGLSDHHTRMLQRLYPVWALIGPGLAEPGHIELDSRTVYLDSDELLGSRTQILTGRLERIRVLTTIGVGLHEVMHAKHTKLWVMERDLALADSDDQGERQLAADRRLLEEPRMEATGCRAFPESTGRGRFVRGALEAAVVNCIVPRFIEQTLGALGAGRPVTRDMVGRAMTYLQARTRYGVLDPGALAPLTPVWRGVLGAADVRALEDLYARAVWIADGDNDALDGAAGEYRAIIGPPDPPPPHDAAGRGRGRRGGTGGNAGTGRGNAGEGGGGGDAGGNDAIDGGGGDGYRDDGGGPGVGSLRDALEASLRNARDAQLEQLNEDVALKDVLDEAARSAARAPERGGIGTGAPTGRMPDRGVDRPPAPDEVQAANRFANELRKAMTLGTRRIDKRTPGGRFDGRAYARGRAHRATGQPVTSHPWNVVKHVTSPIEEPHVLLVIDTSGSMGAHEYALGPIDWIVTEAVRRIGGRVATTLFGNGCAVLSDGGTPLRQVPGIRTGGGTAFAGDAIVAGCEHLDMDDPRRPRAVYVLSDGGWYDTLAGVTKIRELRANGVPTIHISIGMAPLSVECDRVSVIDDPADALDVIARDTVDALRAAGPPRSRPAG